MRKIKRAIQKVKGGGVADTEDDDVDLDDLDKELSGLGFEDDANGDAADDLGGLFSDDEDDAEDAEDFDVGDAVGKALALINQVRTTSTL